jgi:hypothetical protein
VSQTLLASSVNSLLCDKYKYNNRINGDKTNCEPQPEDGFNTAETCSWLWNLTNKFYAKRLIICVSINTGPIPVAVRSKAWVYGRSLAGIVGSNPARGMDVCLLWVLCVVRSLRRAGHSSRGVLPSVMCLKCVIEKPRTTRRPRPPRGCWAIGKKINIRGETILNEKWQFSDHIR